MWVANLRPAPPPDLLTAVVGERHQLCHIVLRQAEAHSLCRVCASGWETGCECVSGRSRTRSFTITLINVRHAPGPSSSHN